MILISGLQLNSFVSHFEPLYYDRHQLLQQYTRLKQNLSDKKSKLLRLRNQQKYDEKWTNEPAKTTNAKSTVIKNSLNSKKRQSSQTQSDPSNQQPRGQVMWKMNQTSETGAVNISNITITTTTTTAFVRHNCPTPSIDLNSTVQSHLAEELEVSVGGGQSVADEPNDVIMVEFKAHNRHFRLLLQSKSERVFAPDVQFESSLRDHIHYDTGNVVHGHLHGKFHLCNGHSLYNLL